MCPQSYVIRLKCPIADRSILRKALIRYGGNSVVDSGHLAVAVVTGVGTNDYVYFVVTTNDGQILHNARTAWSTRMKNVTCYNPYTRKTCKLEQIAYVDRISIFDRSLQRLFGWGDAYATREHVVAAVAEYDTETMAALIPGAASLIADGEWEHLPGIFDAMRSGPPPVPPGCCRHNFFSEPVEFSHIQLGTCVGFHPNGVKCTNVITLPAGLFDPIQVCYDCGTSNGPFTGTLLGPCAMCHKWANRDRAMFTKCSKCNEVRCKPCTHGGDGYINDRCKSFLRAYHDVTDSHEMTEVRDECDRCGRQPCRCGGKHCEECRTKVQTRGCVCGITRCHKCLPPSAPPPVPMVDLIAEINLVVELQSALRRKPRRHQFS